MNFLPIETQIFNVIFNEDSNDLNQIDSIHLHQIN